MNFLEELDGSGWSIQQALLTTFSFDPRFFSEYVRPRLQRRNCDLPVVFVDDRKYTQNIDTEDWIEAPIGSHYLLEPVQTGGVFHPKVNLFASERSVYVTVSSANLTLEEYCRAAQVGTSVALRKSWLGDDDRDVTERYHLVRDVCRFFESLAERDGMITGRDATEYVEETMATLEWVDDHEDQVEPLSERDRTARFVHNLDEPILQQVLASPAVGEVDRAQLYAPFYGSPSVLREILAAIDPDEAELIVESESTAIELEGLSETLETPFEVRTMEHQTTRWVHGKFMTLRGAWGSACLFGSPNMTSTALLDAAASGNAEAAVVRTTSEEDADTEPFTGTLYGNDAFDFDLSPPVESLESLDVRERSYEGWEALQGGRETQLRLLDARLTQPDSEEVSELILRLDGLEDSCDLEIRTEGTDVARTVEADLSEPEVSILVDADERPQWATAVVTVAVPDSGVESNPRRVNEESRAYFREFREMTQSGGTQSSTTLLKQILQNPDTAAINVFDVALSELRERSTSQNPDAGSEQEARQTFEERSPARLAGSTSSTPSIQSLVGQQLSYQLEQATEALDFEDLPTPEEVDSFLEHMETFFETIELCMMLDVMDELSNDTVLAVSRDGFQDFLESLPQFVAAISRLGDLIEDNQRVREAFLTDEEESVRELDFWSRAFDVFYIHPSIILELDYRTPEPVIHSHGQFANLLKSTLDSADPALWMYLFDLPYLEETIQTHSDDLLVRHAEDEPSVTITGEAFQTILLYILVQNSQSNPDFIAEIASHPRYSEENVRRLAQFALEGEELIFEYGLVNDQMWNLVLRQGRNVVETFAE